MADSFYIGAYWDSRAEPLSQVSDKIILTLKRIAEIDDQFLNWYKTGRSRKKALENKVILDNESIEKLCLAKVKRGELNEKGFSSNGFLFSLWSGHEEDEASSISFNVGDTFNTPNLNNRCVITIPNKGFAHERLLEIKKAKAIISVLVEIWNPDYAALTSFELFDALGVGNRIGWITYLKSINCSPHMGENIVYEKSENGHLFYLKSINTRYDLNLSKELESLKVCIRNSW